MQDIYNQFQKNKKFMAKGTWVGFDLDGTLADDSDWKGPYHIGEPIKPMIDLMKDYANNGVEVRIFTARVSSSDKAYVDKVTSIIQSYIAKHAGIQNIKVTCSKDFGLALYYDDRCVQVEQNTGRIIK